MYLALRVAKRISGIIAGGDGVSAFPES